MISGFGFQIEDGRGSGNLVEVLENRLLTDAISQSSISHFSGDEASAYGISTPMLTLTTTGGRVLYIKNTSTTKKFKMSDFWFNWDGGSTNYNRPYEGQLIFGDTEPDTNTTTGGAGNLNRTSSNTASMDVIYWDEVGDGMTGHTAGTAAFYWTAGQGSSHYKTDGAIILGLNDTLSVNAKGIEAGEFSINILGYFE